MADMTGTEPFITASVEDVNSTTIALTGDKRKLIKYHSNAKATMTVEPHPDYAINEDTYIIRNGSRTGYGTTYTFNNVESNRFTFSAEDERGVVGTKTVTPTMVNYVRLTCNMASSRPDGDGDMRLYCTGNFFNGSFGAKSNSLTVMYEYTGSDGSGDEGYMTVTKSGNTYSAYVNLSDLNYQASYSFVITAVDMLETVTATESGVRSKPVFHWSGNDFAFEVPVAFNGGVDFENIWLKGDGEYKSRGKINFGDAFADDNTTGRVYIAEQTDDEMDIYAYNSVNIETTKKSPSEGERIGINFTTPKFMINGYELTWGDWTPSLNSSAVSSYEFRQGWYQVVGNVVTIGFYLRANCRTGYNSTLLEISGLSDYAPAVGFNGYGGGVVYNVYSPYEYAFQGWAVATDGKITARLQHCDSNGNLVTSSSIYYPNGGGTITLGGTISYLADL
jgi:hypothetical protein